MLYLGIDPGKTGGLAVLEASGKVYRVEKMPATEFELYIFLENVWKESYSSLLAPTGIRGLLERVHAFPGMGVSSAFTFGEGFGGIKMALAAAGIPFELVSPRTWQGALGCLSGRDKNVTKRRAQQLFPSVTVTHAIADALLIAEYCRRLERGTYKASARRGRDGEKEKGQSENQALQRQGGAGLRRRGASRSSAAV